MLIFIIVIGKIFENVAFFGDILLRMPDMTKKVQWFNNCSLNAEFIAVILCSLFMHDHCKTCYLKDVQILCVALLLA